MKISFFVSSTFKDMDFERDLLRTVVAERLNLLYEKKGLSFEFVDLRYSISTDNTLTMEEREHQIFDHCMDEIGRCAPYFIGLMGHRYGWVPERKTDSQKAEIDRKWESDLNIDQDEMSVTALEFLQGAIGKINDDRAGKFFYLRSDDSYDRMDEDDLKDYVDPDFLKKKNNIIRDYVKALDGKKGIKVQEYTLNPNSSAADEKERWCDMVVKDISEMIDVKFANQVELDAFYAANERYVAEHIRNFKGREELLDNISNIMNQIYISGNPGTGRTSLLCKAYDNQRISEDTIALFASSHATPLDFNAKMLATKWAKQISVITGIELPSELEEGTNRNPEEICTAYKGLLQDVQELGLVVIHFVEGAIIEFNDLLKNAHLVLLQENYGSNMLPWTIDTTELDEETQLEIAGQLRPLLREKLLTHPSASNIGWLSLAVHILENQMKSQQKEMRKGYKGHTGEEGITAFLCDLVDRFPMELDDLRGFWISQLNEIFGTDFVKDYMCCHKLAPYGLTDATLSQVTGTSLIWCISFRQCAGNNIFALNELNLWHPKSRASSFNILKGQSDNHLIDLAERMKLYLEPMDKDNPEQSNLFSLFLYLKAFNQLYSYFFDDKFYRSPNWEISKQYSWIIFVKERFFDSQTIMAAMIERLPADASIWKEFIAWQQPLPQTSRFLFMRLIEKKIISLLANDPTQELARVMKDVYKISINSAPDPSTKKLELRKYLHFYSDLFNQDIRWREEYLSAVNFLLSFIPQSEYLDFLLAHQKKLEMKNALQYEVGEPTKELAKFFFSLTFSLQNHGNHPEALKCAIFSSELFHNAFIGILNDDLSFKETTLALNCYHTCTLNLIYLYERFNFTTEADKILQGVAKYVHTVDAIIDKFNGFGNPVDDDLLDECRAIYFYARCLLIGANRSKTPEERLHELSELHKTVISFGHYDCKPRDEDYTMPDFGTFALSMLRPEAVLWLSLSQILICCEAAYIIYKYKLEPKECGLFNSFHNAAELAVTFMYYKMLYPGKNTLLNLILNAQKVRTYSVIQANKEELNETDMESLDEKMSMIIQNLDRPTADSEIFIEYLSLTTGGDIDAYSYDEMIENGEYSEIININENLGFLDYYYIGLAYLRLNMCDKAKEIYEMLLNRRRILNGAQELSCICNLLAACLKDLDLEAFEYYYNFMLTEEDREDSDIVELFEFYTDFKSGNITVNRLKDRIEGYTL